jgi:hypothetical protein
VIESCGICSVVSSNAGQIGKVRVCGGCWNLYGQRKNMTAQLQGLTERLVAVDQEIEQDTRVVDLRKQVAALQTRVEEYRNYIGENDLWADFYEWQGNDHITGTADR